MAEQEAGLARRWPDRLTDPARAKLRAVLDRGVPDGEVTAAWLIAQQLRDVDRAPDAAAGRHRALAVERSAARCPRSPASAAP